MECHSKGMRFKRWSGGGKYRNKKCVIDEIKFDSQKEGKRYVELKALLDQGKIMDLKCHPAYLLQEGFVRDGKKHRKITYEADFEYRDVATQKTIIEDVKASKFFVTEVFKIKKKLFLKNLADYIIFTEVY